MKITINFNQEEKRMAAEMMHNVDESVKVDDKDQHYIGSFGEFKYESEENVIEFELKTSFIKAYTYLIVSFINLMKSFMGNCEMFASSWLSDIKDLTLTEEKESEEVIDDIQE